MLLKKKEDGTWTNMTIGHFADMSQFVQEFENYGTSTATIKVTYRAYGDGSKAQTIRIPLVPDAEKLEPFHVNMHGSPTDALNMGSKYSEWFTTCFGYPVTLVYIGDNQRTVIFEDMQPLTPDPLTAWFKKNIPILGGHVERLMGIRQTEPWRIKFQDCAPFLITSKTSLDDVSSRLDGETMDMVKFRPNIVIEGANEPWQEDYWGKIKINQKTEMIMAHNCVRCQSINLDYETGKPGVGASGEVLKRLQKDRRIDVGAKWSPVFGRYTFWAPGAPASQTIKVGDKVNVTKVNEGLTIWSKYCLFSDGRFGADNISQAGRVWVKKHVSIQSLQIAFVSNNVPALAQFAYQDPIYSSSPISPNTLNRSSTPSSLSLLTNPSLLHLRRNRIIHPSPCHLLALTVTLSITNNTIC